MSISEVLLSNDYSRVEKRARLYNYSNLHHRVPINFYFPPSLHMDLSASPTYYYYMAFMVLCAIRISTLAIMTYPVIGIFSIHIRGQMFILIKYIRLVGNQERDSNGNLKYYTNIVTGQYFTWDQGEPDKIVLYTRRGRVSGEEANTQGGMRDAFPDHLDPRDCEPIRKILAYNKQHLMSRAAKDYNPVYEEFFMTQIIQYHQFILDIKDRVQNYHRPVVITTCLYFITLFALSILILLYSTQKITFGGAFILLNLNVAKYVQFSDRLEECNLQVMSLLYADSKWYIRTPRMRTMVKIVLMRTAKSMHFSFHAKFVTFDRPLLLALFSLAYKLVNWLLYMNA